MKKVLFLFIFVVSLHAQVQLGKNVQVGSPTVTGALSGMTAGQVPIAATASTVTSSEALAGSGPGITTGPTSSSSNDCVEFTGTNGQIADSGAACGGLSGMTGAQVPIAATASTVTSSKALAGSGAGITTGPTSSSNDDCVEFTGTNGQIADSGAACGTGGVQYNPAGTNYIFASASEFVVDATNSCEVDGAGGSSSAVTITAWSITSNVVSFTYSTTGTLTAGNIVVLSGFGTSTFFNGKEVTVLSTGLTSTNFEANFTHTNGSNTESGSAACAGNIPQTTGLEPYFAGHGNIVNASLSGDTIANLVSAYTADVHPYTTAVTGKPSYLFVMPTDNEWASSCPTLATLESSYQTYFSDAHADGATVVAVMPIPGYFNTTYCGGAYYQWAELAMWLRAQGKSITNASSGEYFDYLVDASSVQTDWSNAYYFAQTGTFIHHPTENFSQLMANLFNQAMSAQGPSVQADPYGPRTILGSLTVENPSNGTGTGLQVIEPTEANGSWGFNIYLNSSTDIPYEFFATAPQGTGYFIDSIHTNASSSGPARIYQANAVECWNAGNSGAAYITDAGDTCFSRVAAGVLALGSGASGNATGTFRLANRQILEGTAPTNASTFSEFYSDSTAHEEEEATDGTSNFGIVNRTQPGRIDLTARTSSISTATLCADAAGACNTAGLFELDFYLADAVSCLTPGSAAVGVTVTYTDDVGTKSTQTVPLDVNGATSLTGTMGLGTGTNDASGKVIIYSNTAVVQYATTLTACSSGTATYTIHAVAVRK